MPKKKRLHVALDDVFSYLLPGKILTYGLPDLIHVVGHLELRDVLLHLLGQLLRSEAHGTDVVGPHGQGFCRGLHDLQRGLQAVIDVHHGQPGVRPQVTLELASLYGIVENLDSVIWGRE